jgi:hypothetical protein
MANTGKIILQVVNGARQPFSGDVDIRLFDGDKNGGAQITRKGPTIIIENVPCFDNTRDDYTVLASASGMVQAGYFPVRVAPNTLRPVFLMLLPRDGSFNFNQAHWNDIATTLPDTQKILGADINNSQSARDRYESLLENGGSAAAGMWNILTAMGQLNLSTGTALSYFRQVRWDESLAQDRFFGFADKRLLDQMQISVLQKTFKPEVGSAMFHKGATSSFKQVQFGEANVQLTFHENDPAPDGCVSVEPDMDYFQDLAGHALIEVMHNTLTGKKSDPKTIYALRWIAGMQAGVPEFNPPYTIV